MPHSVKSEGYIMYQGLLTDHARKHIKKMVEHTNTEICFMRENEITVSVYDEGMVDYGTVDAIMRYMEKQDGLQSVECNLFNYVEGDDHYGWRTTKDEEGKWQRL